MRKKNCLMLTTLLLCVVMMLALCPGSPAKAADGDKYPIHFDPNGGTGTMEPGEVTVGENYKIPECEFEPPEGQTFRWWKLSGVDGIFGYQPEEEVLIADNCIPIWDGFATLTAYWKDADPPEIEAEPEGKKLTYNGSAQQLISEGKVNGGIMKYVLGNNGNTAPDSGWATTIPTGTKAGTYYVWRKVFGDQDHCNIKPACITVKIEAALAEKLTLKKTKATLIRTGKENTPTLKLKATIQPSYADQNVTWSSNKPKIAKVDKNGKVTALKAGTATITCTANDGSGVKATCTITVKDVKVTKITLNKTKAKMKVKETLQLKVKKFTPASPLNTKVKWTTSDKKIATVDKNGKVKAKKAGKVTITCTAQDGSKKTAKCTITVK